MWHGLARISLLQLLLTARQRLQLEDRILFRQAQLYENVLIKVCLLVSPEVVVLSRLLGLRLALCWAPRWGAPLWLRTQAWFWAEPGVGAQVRLAGVRLRAVGTVGTVRTVRTVKGGGGLCWGMRQGIGTLRSWDANWDQIYFLGGVHWDPGRLWSRFSSKSGWSRPADVGQCCRGGPRLWLPWLHWFCHFHRCNYGLHRAQSRLFIKHLWRADERRLLDFDLWASDQCTRARFHFGPTRLGAELFLLQAIHQPATGSIWTIITQQFETETRWSVLQWA